jgi:hypothetical protein
MDVLEAPAASIFYVEEQCLFMAENTNLDFLKI